jgi:molecular chaperone GrpE (heat shock protein)
MNESHPEPSPQADEPAHDQDVNRMEAALRASHKSGAFSFSGFGSLADALPAKNASIATPAAGAVQNHFEEVADDLLELLRQVQSLSAAQAELSTKVDALSAAMQDRSRSASREVTQIREDLLSERRGLALRSVFDKLIEPWERLRNMSEALARQPSAPPPKKFGGKSVSAAPSQEQIFRNQLQAVVSILGRALRELGCEEFTPAAGEPFDPHTMDCVAYAPGPQGVVIRCIKPGFRAGAATLSPAQVSIADPQTAAPEQSNKGAQ